MDRAVAVRRLRIVSYNVYKGNYLHDAADGARSVTADFAASARLREADVLLVQEAVVGTLARGRPHRDAMTTLAGAIALTPDSPMRHHTRFLGEPHGHAAHWGVAVLSRHAARFHDVPLPRPRWSPWPRGAIVAEIGPFIVATLHLEVWPIGAPARRRQVATLLEALAAVPGVADRPVIVAGDFNCERGAAHDMLRRAGFRAAALSGPTWGWGGILRLRLDHAYVRGGHITAAGVESGARGSDHFPIWIEIESESLQTVP
jgi:endonuclease/exonuclease/phosphatase family metal-dependent hydrolase